MSTRSMRAIIALFTATATIAHADLAAWRSCEKHAVEPDHDRHSIHAYFNTCPESPDGKHVLYFTSTTAEGESGDIRILERATGKKTILAENVTCEDAHRAACQQWSVGGRFVVYQTLTDGRWSVHAVDIATKKDRILALDRQIGYGSVTGKFAPVYGCHWNPGQYRDLELIDVATGEITTAVTAAETLAEYGDAIEKRLGSRDLTIFFPVLSPDESKVFFKPCIPGRGTSYKGMSVSKREGKAIYDLANRTFFGKSGYWAISVGSTSKDEFTVVDLFDNTQGAKSWRRSHPHPAFSSDGKRIYYNVCDGPWTRLMVAEAK